MKRQTDDEIWLAPLIPERSSPLAFDSELTTLLPFAPEPYADNSGDKRAYRSADKSADESLCMPLPAIYPGAEEQTLYRLDAAAAQPQLLAKVPLKLLFPVAAAHLIVFGLLAWKLSFELGPRPHNDNKPKALQSYLVFSPKAVNALQNETKAEEKEEVKPEARLESQSEPQPQQQQEERKPDETLHNVKAAQQQLTEPSKREALPPIVKPPETSDEPVLKETLTASPSPDTKLDFSTPASRFMARQNEQALTALSERYASDKTAHFGASGRSMSELLPEMEVLLVPSADDFYKPNTLDSDIDPNRIVKSGDTCYRVVKVPTPINPHAENLGFPFRCGEDRVKKALKEGINKYLALMGKKDLH